tara:strand:+ start:134 stop:535 length:402 start_codon:yes stop_codon:yes gene_type:complete
MKQLLITITAVVMVGCGPSQAPKISLFEAAVNGDLKAIRQHISIGTDISENTTERTETPLLGAILLGVGWYNTGPHKIKVLQLLISNGADVNAKTVRGKTCLDVAKEMNEYEVIKLLLEHGAKTAEELNGSGY